ncbi:hypothetical protein TNCV_2429561 [Trichonephila clavipes]|nr:hypothetical protein TNCV_2429561 [Trichonephila clavipes]
MVPKIKSRRSSQKYINFGFTTTEVNDGKKSPSSICVETYKSVEQHVKVVFKTSEGRKEGFNRLFTQAAYHLFDIRT